MLLQKGSREDAIHALINTWLADKTLSCGWCGRNYDPLDPMCCEQPFIATNAEVLSVFNKQMMKDRESRKNDFASTDSKSMRWVLSFPPGLLEFLSKSFKKMYGEELFNKEYDMTWFSKKFGKYFAVPRKV